MSGEKYIMQNSKKLKLQVVCLTYNHEKFIRDALNGFVMQKTKFPFEVLIGDDASTDGTADIIREYAEKYPDIIKPILRKKNIGAQENSVDLLKRVNAQYLALCEGDDYWTNPYKLQTQVDYLDAHPECNGCWHNAEIKKEPDVTKWNSDFFFPADKHGKQFWPNSICGFNPDKKEYLIADVLNGYIATASIVYRYPSDMKYPDWFRRSVAGDRAMHCFMIRDKHFAYINKTMSVYRVSKTGAWFNKNSSKNRAKELKEWIDFIKRINKFLGPNFDKYFNEYIISLLQYKIIEAKSDNDLDTLVFVLKNYPEDFSLVKNFVNQEYECPKKFVWRGYMFKIPVFSLVVLPSQYKFYLFGVRILKIKRD